MMQYLSPLFAFVALLAAIGACAFLYYDIGRSALAIGEARSSIAAIAARDTFAKTAAQFLAETSVERSAVLQFVTPPEGTASAIELVENAAKIANVRATVGAATLTPLKEKRHEELNITVSAEGTFAGVARFATVLESLPRASYLSNVDIEASSKGWYATYVVSFIKLK